MFYSGGERLPENKVLQQRVIELFEDKIKHDEDQLLRQREKFKKEDEEEARKRSQQNAVAAPEQQPKPKGIISRFFGKR